MKISVEFEAQVNTKAEEQMFLSVVEIASDRVCNVLDDLYLDDITSHTEARINVEGGKDG